MRGTIVSCMCGLGPLVSPQRWSLLPRFEDQIDVQFIRNYDSYPLYDLANWDKVGAKVFHQSILPV